MTVTSRNTVKHWVLYTLDALEADSEPDGEGTNEAREVGVYPEDVYEYAAGDDSIVFKNGNEVQGALSALGRDAAWYNNDQRAVNRRTDATKWDGPDVRYRYRLTNYGREALLNLGVPAMLPDRQRDGYNRDLGGAKPAHKPGWWRPDYELYSSEWDPRDNDWIASDVHDRVYFKDEGDAGLARDRGYASIGKRLAEIDAFEDVTFVLTVGPYRMTHDIAYAIRDPWRKVVQIDVYSPMALHRSNDEIRANFERLVHDLRRGLKTVHEEYGDESPPDADSGPDRTARS